MQVIETPVVSSLTVSTVPKGRLVLAQRPAGASAYQVASPVAVLGGLVVVVGAGLVVGGGGGLVVVVVGGTVVGGTVVGGTVVVVLIEAGAANLTCWSPGTTRAR